MLPDFKLYLPNGHQNKSIYRRSEKGGNIRITFPSVGVIKVSFNLTGLPASLGKHKKPGNIRCLAFLIALIV
jgi:hypothetical protein